MKRTCSLFSSLLFVSFNVNAGLDDFKSHYLPESTRAPAGQVTLSVMFLGVTTLLFDDGETAILTDGYFSRPAFSTLARLEPNSAVISSSLRRAGVKNLAAVIPLHSHFDHALDSPRVAQETGALLVGTMASANIARGQGLSESAIRTIGPNDSLSFGKFKVSFVKSAHLPITFAMGDIAAPLSFPAKASEMQMGGAYSLLIEHQGRTIMVQGSAGYVPGAMAGKKADVVYLGIGGLATQDAAYQDAYWLESVQLLGARRVVATHWDNFYLPLDKPLAPAPGFDKAMNGLLDRAKKDSVEVRLQREWQWVDPFAGLVAR